MQTQIGTLRSRRRCQGNVQGFTLVEVVAVVIILGILAAILLSRYLEFANIARDTAAKGVASEGVTRFKSAYSQYLLDAHTKPTTLSDLSGSDYLALDGAGHVNIGDYDLAYTQSNNILTIAVYAVNGTTSLATTSVTWP